MEKTWSTRRSWLRHSNSQYVALLLIFFVALGFRFYKLGDWSFWIDEMYTVNGAKYIGDWPPARLPFYLALTRLSTELFGISEWSARLAPALIGSFTIPLLYFPTKRIFGKEIALLASLLLAISLWHIFWSQNARFYSLLLLFYNLGLFYFYIGLTEGKKGYLLLSLVCLVLAMRERELAFYAIPVVGAYFLLLLILPFEKPDWLRWRNFFLAGTPLILFFIYDGANYLINGNSYFITLVTIFVGNPIDTPIRILILILFNIGLPIICLALAAMVILYVEKSKAGLFVTVAAGIPIILLVAASKFIFTVDRYALITLPAWIILAATAIYRLYLWLPKQDKLLAGAVTLILIADALGGHLMYYQINRGNRLDWRNGFTYVEQRMAEGEIIVTTRPEIGAFYLGEEAMSLKDFDPVMAVNQNQRIWFVIDSESVWFASNQTKRWVEKESDLLELWYLRVRETRNLRIYLYDPAAKN